jgi:hypothetical protein
LSNSGNLSNKNGNYSKYYEDFTLFQDAISSCIENAHIEPLIKATIALGTMVYTDEYVIYNPLQDWGYVHQTVCHGVGEYARDEDGDGFCEV